MRRRILISWSLCLLLGTVVNTSMPPHRKPSQNQIFVQNPPVHTPPIHPPPVSDGHRMITRALWRIFDALMEKKEQVKRMSQVEAAVKTMINSDTKLEEEVRKMKEDLKTVKTQTSTLINEIERIKGINTRLNDLENWQLTLQRQGDQDIQAAYSGCPEPYVHVGGECFHVSLDTKLSWYDSRRHCVKLSGGDLASPWELKYLRRHLDSLSKRPEYVWVGGMFNDGVWQWTTGEEPRDMDMSKETWNDNLPSYIGNCVGLYEGASYRAYDYNCTEQDYFVCQYTL